MKRLQKILTVMFILIILSTITKASSTDSFKLSLEPVANEFSKGETFEVKIFLDEIQVESGEQGIAGYTAKLVYDESALSLEKVSASEGWEVTTNGGAIVANTLDTEVVKTKTETVVATFKINDSASLGDTTISIENIEGTSIAETIEGTGTSTTIRIAEEQEPGTGDDQDNEDGQNPGSGNDQDNENGQNPGSGNDQDNENDQTSGNGDNQGSNNGNNQSGKNTTNNINGGNQSYKGVLPYAGNSGYILIVVGIVLIIIGGICLYNYRKYRKV